MNYKRITAAVLCAAIIVSAHAPVAHAAGWFETIFGASVGAMFRTGIGHVTNNLGIAHDTVCQHIRDASEVEKLLFAVGLAAGLVFFVSRRATSPESQPRANPDGTQRPSVNGENFAKSLGAPVAQWVSGIPGETSAEREVRETFGAFANAADRLLNLGRPQQAPAQNNNNAQQPAPQQPQAQPVPQPASAPQPQQADNAQAQPQPAQQNAQQPAQQAQQQAQPVGTFTSWFTKLFGGN